MNKLQRNVLGITFFHHNISDTDRNLRSRGLMWMIKRFFFIYLREKKDKNELEQT